jgi:hypothetical protein
MPKNDDQPVNSVWDAMDNPGCGCVVILGFLMVLGILVWLFSVGLGKMSY